MKSIFQLIELYVLACELYDKGRANCFQRLSNNTNPGGITDQELIAIYWFGHLHQRFSKQAMHDLIRDYWGEYFPKLPVYQTFVARLNQLEPTFQAIGAQLQAQLNARQLAAFDQLVDSMPIALARGGHAYTAKVARETADVGYCASKKLFFHGVKLHAVATRRSGQLPHPQELWLREASCNDLRSFKEQALDVPLTTLFGDKAYCDRALAAALAEQGITLRTPQKQLKGTALNEWQKYYNRCVSRLRQPLAPAHRRLLQLAAKENPDSPRQHCTF